MTVTIHPGNWVHLLGYVAAVLFVLAYLRLDERRARVRQWAWSCFICGIILFITARSSGDAAACIVFATFALLGLVGVIRTRYRKPKLQLDAMGEVEDSIANLAAKVAANLGVPVEQVQAGMERAAEDQARRDMLKAERQAER